MDKKSISLRTFDGWFFWIALFALLAALILTVLSVMDLCTSACVEGQKWRFFGFKFEVLGLGVFPLLILFHILSISKPLFRMLASLMIAASVGAEAWFLYVQKVLIGGFCPICVSIAFSIFVAGMAYFIRFVKESIQSSNEGSMHTWIKIFPSMGTIFLGFLAAFIGVSKINPLEAKQVSLKESIRFGSNEGPIEVYVFTDWFCPACRRVEPVFEAMIPDLKDKAPVFFVDATVHPESLNFTPYNLSFMINNKNDYFKLRKALEQLADKNDSPSDTDIQEAINPHGVQLKELAYSDVALGVKLFKKLVKQFDITQTPTVVIVNMDSKKGKKLSGYGEITKENVLKAVDSLQ
ncbi:thioredoxin domain-containing protein [Estrella lausannensis]|uniref:Conserved putative membrane protein n=1 Tax=Estrella lausannensis TaxID=483423 RepID=A0A0H5DRZ3_9BACT|nr:thioredoxin domain-containing protein [Estrella lausannensis]CRX38489.1 Conserved putative membrane protein [Estrella lausannensis]